jgi:glycolate oxidase FAD binding subunit
VTLTTALEMPGVESRRPTSLAQAQEALTAGGAMVFSGGGTKLDWGRAPESVDAVVSTAGMDRILVHNAADATVKVQAGLPLSRLQDELQAAGQWLAVDPVGGPDATVGGILATDDAGPRRLSYGTLRDLVIGVTVVLADGAVARSGGFVIKNVAGYDLGRLLCGSFGTLGLVAEISLRLHPRPERTGSLRIPAGPAQAVRIVSAVSTAALEPVAVDYDGASVWLRFAGRPDAVSDQIRWARGLLTGPDHAETAKTAYTAGTVDMVETIDEDAQVWTRLTESLAGVKGETVVRIGTLPTHLPEVAQAVSDSAADNEVDVALASHVAVGAHTVRMSRAGVAEHARFVTDLRGRLAMLAPVPGHVVVWRRLDGLDRHVDPWGMDETSPGGSALGLMRAVKKQLDPERRCAPGRFVGGI